MTWTQHDIETESLPAHVSICQERYRALQHKFDSVDLRLDRIENSLQTLNQSVADLAEKHNHRWDTAQLATISLLIGFVGFLLARLFPV